MAGHSEVVLPNKKNWHLPKPKQQHQSRGTPKHVYVSCNWICI